jgi:hypothetical protein
VELDRSPSKRESQSSELKEEGRQLIGKIEHDVVARALTAEASFDAGSYATEAKPAS